MKTKHTPGPWKHVASSKDSGGNVTCWSVVEDRGRWITHADFASGVDGEDEANARLMAAAPDMEKALTAFMLASHTFDGPLFARARKLGGAALRKSTGKEAQPEACKWCGALQSIPGEQVHTRNCQEA